MNKKILVAAIAVATAAAGTSAFAATTLGGATQKGSLLIFPRIEAETGDHADRKGRDGLPLPATDTYVSITNDSTTPVNVQCYWGTTEQEAVNQPVGPGGNAAANANAAAARVAIRNNHYMDFSFTLTKNQPATFWAGDLSALANGTIEGHHVEKLTTTLNAPQFNGFQDGTTSNAGELKCWAVNTAGDKEIHHNHLTGKAMVATFANSDSSHVGQAHEYNAWAFQANYYQKAQTYPSNSISWTGRVLPTPGALNLDGKEYDQCPSALLGQFIPTGHPLGDSVAKRGHTSTQVTVANCHEDLRQDADAHITKLTYTVWNAGEVKYTGAHECMGAWYESDLGEKFPHFTYKTLKSDSAYFRAVPTASKLCNQGSQKLAAEADIEVSSVVGIQVNDIGGRFQTSSNLTGLGSGTTYTNEPVGKGQILWDANGANFGKK